MLEGMAMPGYVLASEHKLEQALGNNAQWAAVGAVGQCAQVGVEAGGKRTG